MPKFSDTIFVLLGDRFEEAVAAVFITEFREVGLRVKVVGLVPRLSGSHGLALVPDLTLDQALALASKAVCLVIPHPLSDVRHFRHDPRVCQLFERACANGAKFVLKPFNGADPTDLGLPDVASGNLFICPDSEDLIRFARATAGILMSGE